MINAGVWKGGGWKKEATEGARCTWEDNKMRDGKGREGRVAKSIRLTHNT